MNGKLERIAARRRQLAAEISRQRQSLQAAIEPLRTPLARLDNGLEVLRYAKRHPVLMAGTGFLLLSLHRGGRTGTWLGRCWVAWRVLNTYRNSGSGAGRTDSLSRH